MNIPTKFSEVPLEKRICLTSLARRITSIRLLCQNIEVPRVPWFRSRFFFHPPQHEPARRRRGHVQVITLGVVAEQLDPQTRVQPALEGVGAVQQAWLAAETFLLQDDLVQPPAPGLPAVVDALAARTERGATA